MKDNKELKERVLLENDNFIVKCSSDGRIVIDTLCEVDSRALLRLGDIISKLNGIEMSKGEKEEYKESIRNICYLVSLDEDLAIKNMDDLENCIEQGLRLKKRIQYVSIVGSLFLILIIVCLLLSNKYKDITYVCICSSLGGILAVFYKQDTLNIDYSIAIYAIILEAVKRVVMTIVVGIIGFIAIKADVILPNFDTIANDYTLALVMVICGYSINFVPNILDEMLQSNISKK